MRVLIINKLYYPWIGGVEKHVQDLSEGLQKKSDHNVSVLCVSERLLSRTRDINKVRVKKLFNLASLIRKTLIFSMPISLTFPLWMKKIKADILHFHLPFPLGVISYLITKPKGRLAVTYHSDIVKQKFILFFYKYFLKKFLQKANVIIATSDNLVNNSKILCKFKEKCRVVSLGIDREKFKINKETEKVIEEIKSIVSGRIVLFVGRFIYYKGIKYLLDAFKDIDAMLVLLGSGPLEEKIQDKIRENNITHKVIIIKEPTDLVINAYYHVCEFLVLPSTHSSEAFGIVQLEAMVCGKPVISTNIPTGVPFVNQHEKTGLIVEPANAGQLNCAIKELLNNDEKRKQLGSNAKRRVEEEFTNEVMVDKISKIYNSL